MLTRSQITPEFLEKLDLSDVSIWRPETEHDLIVGVFLGAMDFEFPDEYTGAVQVRRMMVLAEMDDEERIYESYWAIPPWNQLVQAVARNIDRLKIGSTITIKMDGTKEIPGRMPMKLIRLSIDGVPAPIRRLITSPDPRQLLLELSPNDKK